MRPLKIALTLVATIIVALFLIDITAPYRDWAYWQLEVDGKATKSEIVRNLGLLVAAVLALIVGIWRAWSADRQTKISNDQARLSERGLFTDRFSRAVENVSSRDLAIRLGGVDALCRMAAEAQNEDYKTVMDQLCALVRVPPHREGELIRKTQDNNFTALRSMGRGDDPKPREAQNRNAFRADVQEILNNLFGVGVERLVRDGYEANLSEAVLSEAYLKGAYLREAYLREAYLWKANLSEADLREADLSEAVLSGANLIDANLIDANLSEAYLDGANLRKANLRGAYLREADLSEADLNGANLSETNLSETNLSGAKNLTQEQIDRGYFLEIYGAPQLPDGFTPPPAKS